MWDDEAIDSFIEEKFPNHVDFYHSLPHHIIRLDFFRFALLYEEGGIYADMDMYCVRNFYDELYKDVAFVESPYIKGELENSLMAAMPKNPHLLRIMFRCRETFAELGVRENITGAEGSQYVLELCGPQQITKYLAERSKEEQKEVQRLRYPLFNPHAERADPTRLEKYFTIHMNTGNWGKDFTEWALKNLAHTGETYEGFTKRKWASHSPVWARRFGAVFPN
jgi:mannosyltransferase OCH1-like enzyme